jgi:hypothetical protein
MKIKFIITIMFFTLVGFFSCKKENTMNEPSDAVNEFFGYKKGAEVLSNTDIEITNNKFAQNSIKINKDEQDCQKFETLPNGDWVQTFYPCSGSEGNITYSIDDITHFSRFTMNICSSEGISPQNCRYLIIESGPVSGNINFINSDLRYTMEGKPDFNCITEMNFTYDGQEEYDPAYPYIYLLKQTYLNGSILMKRGEISYSSSYIEPVVVKYFPKSISLGNLPFDILKVQGIEKVTYERNGLKGEFIINYGNGELDSTAIITENGGSYEMNYLEFENMRYFEMTN